MTFAVPIHRPSSTVRRFGYLLAAVVNAALWYVINARPGWQIVPFLTEDTRRVLTLVNLSLLAGIVANVVYAVYDSFPLKSLGDLVTDGISLAVLIRAWQVFPFAFPASGFDWSLLTRVVLVVGIGGTGIAIAVHLVRLLRMAVHHDNARRVGPPGS